MTQLAIRFTDEQLQAVDRIIKERRGIPDRATIIREFLSRGLRISE